MLSDLTVTLFGDDLRPQDWAPLMHDAYIVAQGSPDPSTQNGAILLNPDGDWIGHDHNHFPAGVEYTAKRWERPLKYEVIEHAERNAIFHAARLGRSTQNSTMVVPWAACADCARAIIQAGVKRIVRHKQSTERGRGRNWDGSISIADTMLVEAGVEIIDFVYVFGDEKLSIMHSGEVFVP